jgi:putative aldouronate transport system substrate-binding protein
MNPQLNLSSDAIEAIHIINERINPYVAETLEYFITGELSIEKDWNEYLLELEKRGYKTLEEIWNAAWDEQNK